jgi:putative peptide zinc metalloprotease protein
LENLSIIKLIERQVFFSNFKPSEIKELAKLFIPKKFNIGEQIVREGDLVDSIFLIECGRAEVSKKIRVNETLIEEPIGTLSDTDNIGLAHSGFFSQTGMRTATVTALTDVIAYCLTVSDLFIFLKNHPEDKIVIEKNTDLIFRTNFIKNCFPFVKMEINSLIDFANKLKKIYLEKGKFLFKQNDPADHCYLVQRGTLQVFITDSSGATTTLATVGPEDIVGESSLFLNAHRNASVQSITDCTLLMIEKHLFSEITHVDENIRDSFVLLHESRSRPQKKAGVEVFKILESQNETFFTFRNLEEKSYFRTSEEGKFIWDQIDGILNISDLTFKYYEHFNELNYTTVSSFITSLYKAKMIDLDIHEKKELPLDWFNRCLNWFEKKMTISYSFPNPDPLIEKAFNNFIYLFFKKPTIIFLIALIITGIVVFSLKTGDILFYLKSHPLYTTLFFVSYALSILVLPLHELSHGFCAKFFGKKVFSFGVGFINSNLFAFCDTSDMWLNPSKERVAVDFAGIFINLIMAAIASIFLIFNFNEMLDIILWFFAFSNYIFIFNNLNPINDLDGYHAISNVLNRPNLRKDSIEWVANTFSMKKLFLFLKSIKSHKKEAFYLASIIAYLFVAIVLHFFILYYLIAEILQVEFPYLSIFILIFVIYSSLSLIFLQIKK